MTPSLGAWVGVAADGVEAGPGRSGFGAAQTVPSLGTSNYGLVAAGDAAGRSLLVWHARSGDRWRIQFTTVAADGHITGSGWLTPPGDDNANPAIAMAPDGSGVVAWTNGMSTVQARAIEASGAFGVVEDLGTAGGGSASARRGRRRRLACSWPGAAGAGAVSAARRAPGAKSFGAAEVVGGSGAESVAASLTSAGDAIVAWTDTGHTRATAAERGSAFDPPVTLAPGGGTVAAGGDRVLWDETSGADHRIRTAYARGGGDAQLPTTATHRRGEAHRCSSLRADPAGPRHHRAS